MYRIFCNISPATIYDVDFFTRFTDYLDANEDLAQRLVFEFTYPAVEMMHAMCSGGVHTACADLAFQLRLSNRPRRT